MKNWSILLLTVCLSSAFVRAGDFERDKLDNWHQWRGPEANGVAPKGDPPTRWDEKTNIKWKTPLPGRGSSTPVVWGNKVFVLTAIDTGREADPKEIPKPEAGFAKKTNAPTT